MAFLEFASRLPVSHLSSHQIFQWRSFPSPHDSSRRFPLPEFPTNSLARVGGRYRSHRNHRRHQRANSARLKGAIRSSQPSKGRSNFHTQVVAMSRCGMDSAVVEEDRGSSSSVSKGGGG